LFPNLGTLPRCAGRDGSVGCAPGYRFPPGGLDLNPRFPHFVGMVQRSDIIEYANEVARQFQPERVILFGSYAEGKATADSDVDLFVEMEHTQSALQQALAIRKAIRRTFPLDLVVKSPREIKQRLEQNDFFLKTIMDNGQVLYERAG